MLAIREEELTEEQYGRLTEYLQSLDILKNVSTFNQCITLFARQRYIRQGAVEAMLNLEKEDARAVVNLLAQKRMIEETTGGYRKTARFNAYIAKCFQKGMFNDINDDI
jgi:hypothetical protein